MKAKVGAATMVRLGEGVAERIDAVAGKGQRAAFIRAAVLEKLGAGRKEPLGPRVTEAVPVKASPIGAKCNMPPESIIKDLDNASGGQPEFRVLLAHLRKGSRSEREAARDLGWPEMKVGAAAKGLSAAGLIRYEHGSMVVA